MLKYNCTQCNFFTNNKTDYNRHKKTKKHVINIPPCSQKNEVKTTPLRKEYIPNNKNVQNVEKRRKTSKNGVKTWFTCVYCTTTFTRSHGLSRHQNICSLKNEHDENEKLKQKLREAQKELQTQQKEINDHKTEKEYYKKLIDNYSKMGPRTFNSLTYVMNNYGDAPHLRKIEPHKIEFFQNVGDTSIENIISDYRNKKIVSSLVSIIKKMHSKEDPKNQSIWSTDTSRYNYIIKELLENEGSYWIVDKKGTKSKNYIVEPILNYLRNELIHYNKRMYHAMETNSLTKKRISLVIDTQKDACELIKEIDSGELALEIVKKLARHLYHKTGDTPLIEEMD